MDLPKFESLAGNYIHWLNETKRLVDAQAVSKQPHTYAKRIAASQKRAGSSFGKISSIIGRFYDRRFDLGDGYVVDPFAYALSIQGKEGSSVIRIAVIAMHALVDKVRETATEHPGVPLEKLPKRRLRLPIEFGNDTEALSKSKPDVHTRIFLVHGHNERVVHETARFLERFHLEVVILREQPNSGRTIIEKFVDYSDVGFAVVLLTGDDRGGTKSTPLNKMQPRARQNVIMELGFFIGKLGRARVCALYEEGVEIPSDYRGVLFVAIDPAGTWRLELARELKAAGVPIDFNKI